MSKWVRLLAVLGILAIVAAACSDSGNEGGSSGATGGTSATGGTAATGSSGGELPGVGVTACEVTDTGGIDDKSFNATAYAGITQAQDELGITGSVLESQTQDDYAPNIQTFLDQGCDLIVTVGFLLGDATLAAATDNPDQKFAIVDVDFFDFDKGKDITLDNAKELTFQTDQAAFLAGYLAAGMSQSGKIGTFGGINIPPVTIFMNGFAAGILAYNQDNGTSVELLGWNPDTQKGYQVSSDPAVGFYTPAEGRRAAEDFLSEGADIILPVAGGTGLGTMAAIEDAGGALGIWVDTDGCVAAGEFCNSFLTTVEKHMDVAVRDSVQAVLDDTFQGGLYVGTLKNDGVGIADFLDSVPQE